MKSNTVTQQLNPARFALATTAARTQQPSRTPQRPVDCFQISCALQLAQHMRMPLGACRTVLRAVEQSLCMLAGTSALIIWALF